MKKTYLSPMMAEQPIQQSTVLCASGEGKKVGGGPLDNYVPEGATPTSAV